MKVLVMKVPVMKTPGGRTSLRSSAAYSSSAPSAPGAMEKTIWDSRRRASSSWRRRSARHRL
ncbi:hypothetical protein EYF80_066512 [Liparis tanakae]|uniref:Uncharacterized protein n=1 Tax=Liparis tanakae TaxID=230148 RepID=A0A4Z2E3R2_9TELE|nr:hypothetical protein EYF80_066512 [Liparis tanakae]